MHLGFDMRVPFVTEGNEPATLTYDGRNSTFRYPEGAEKLWDFLGEVK
jgi:hypothetical protein